MRYMGGGTNTADAIKYMRQNMFSQSGGARPNVPRIGMLHNFSIYFLIHSLFHGTLLILKSFEMLKSHSANSDLKMKYTTP